MHRIDSVGSVSGKFTEGNPAGGQKATRVSAAWLNDVQENLVDIISFANIALVKGDSAQLRQAVLALVAGVVGTGDGGVPTTRQVTGAGLATGGGALAADLVLTVPKATAAEVQAGTDDSKAVTPLALANSTPKLLGTNGYYTLPGGLIIQWMQALVGANGMTNLTLPTSFPNQCFAAVTTGGASGANAQDNNPFVIGVGTSVISIYSSVDISLNTFTIAIGR